MADDGDKLLERAVGGDRAALAELLTRYGPMLRAELNIDRRWQTVLEPDDVLQVTYLEAFLHITSFAPNGLAGFYTWLKRIAENNLRDAIKGLERQKRPQPEQRVEVRTGENSAIQLLDLLGVTSATPSRQVAHGELIAAFEAAMQALPPDYATVVRMYDLESRSITDVAAAVKRSPGAVHMLRARAHARLGELLGPGSQFFSHAP